MKLADPMREFHGFDQRALGAGKESIETPAGSSALFVGVLSTVASKSEPEDVVNAKSETGTPTIDAFAENPDPARAEIATFGPRNSWITREVFAGGSQVAGEGQKTPQIGARLSDITQTTSASTASPASAAGKALKTALAEHDVGDGRGALGLMNMLLSNSSLSSPQTSRNATATPAQPPQTFKERADAVIAQPGGAGMIQPDATSAGAADAAVVARGSDGRQQRKAEGDGPRDLVAMLLSGLSTQSFPPLQAAAGGELPSSSMPCTVGATAHVDAAHVPAPSQMSSDPSGATASLSGGIGTASVGTINAVPVIVDSVSTHLGSTPASAPSASISPLSAAKLPSFNLQAAAERIDSVPPMEGTAAQTATEQEPETPTHSDGDAELRSFHTELLTSRPTTASDASPLKSTPARSRVVATNRSRSDELVSNDAPVRGENTDAPTERSQKSVSASRADHGAPGDPSARSVSEPTGPAIGDTPRRQIASSISRIAAAVTEIAQRSVSSSTNSTASLASARTLTLRMDQPDLGPISIRMHLAGRSLDLHLTVSNHATAALLQREHETLTAALGDNSYRLHSLVIQGDGATSTTASGKADTGVGGQNTRAGSHDPTPQGGNRNNANVESDRQRRQGDKPDPSPSLVRGSRGSLFV